MNENFVATLSALANDLRLSVFRLLMRTGPEGMPAGDIAARLQVPPSTLSAHLAQMCRAGLLRSVRDHQRIIYAIDVDGTRELISFLTDDCCQGRPEICGYGAAPVCAPSAPLENSDA